MNTAQRPRLFDRVMLTLLALASVTWVGWQNGIGRFDYLLYDVFLNASPAPPSSDVVIVAIDDASLATVGRWPWRRSQHVDLIERISAHSPRAIGLDLLLSEPDLNHPQDDTQLAAAMQRSGVVVLPVFMADVAGRGYVAVPPLEPFADSAAALGHVSLEIDRDGIVRSVFLEEGEADALWPHLALSLLDVGQYRKPGATVPGQQASAEASLAEPGDGWWYRNYQLAIAYAGPPGTFQHVSARDVLAGSVDGQLFRNRIVLIGPTAAGLGDVYTTPVSGHSILMPGVEIIANVVGNVLSGRTLQYAAPWQNAMASLGAVVILLLGLWRLAPRRALALMLALLAVTPAASWLAMRFTDYWFAPGGALAVMVALYALWNWRRLEAALRYLDDELKRLRNDDPTLPAATAEPKGDLLDRRINSLHLAASHLRLLHRFVSSAIASLPDITLVVSDTGRILMANQAAALYFEVDAPIALRGRPVNAYLQGVLVAQDGRHLIAGHPQHSLSHAFGAGFQATMEAIGDAITEYQDSARRQFLLKVAPCSDPGGAFSVWIISLMEITALRQAEQKRDEALRFLSHDIRAPQASILALLDMYQENPDNFTISDVIRRVRDHAGRAQLLAENFIQLARMESVPLQLMDIDYGDVLTDAVDTCWESAQSGRIDVQLVLPEAPAYGYGDRAILTRVCVNLIGNAIKYSPSNSTVVCSLHAAGPDWCLSVRDQGCGIAEHDRHRIFQLYAQLEDEHGEVADSGVGLGLAFARLAIARHGGRIEFDSKVNVGTEFRVYLPASNH